MRHFVVGCTLHTFGETSRTGTEFNGRQRLLLGVECTNPPQMTYYRAFLQHVFATATVNFSQCIVLFRYELLQWESGWKEWPNGIELCHEILDLGACDVVDSIVGRFPDGGVLLF
jgi:hypothetical protein